MSWADQWIPERHAEACYTKQLTLFCAPIGCECLCLKSEIRERHLKLSELIAHIRK